MIFYVIDFFEAPDAGKDRRQKEKGRQRMRWFSGITDSMDMNLSELREPVLGRGAWHAALCGVTKSLKDLATEQQLP